MIYYVYFEILFIIIIPNKAFGANTIEINILICLSTYLHMKLRENDIIVISKSLDKGFYDEVKMV